ncbi:MAG: pyridoxal 5'-phosphate synthase glutaminase subunit PdxT [Firmicutes bacterium]|nr:pyridoxal 5'-phosphate synthase glutaminase subunit PdxT [Bacillota bacterium]
MAKIGVLAVQGAVSEHLDALAAAGAEARPVKRPGELEGLDGLVLPGGESTTIGRLAEEYGLLEAIRREHERGLAVWGTCAGLILLAREIQDGVPGQPGLRLMDVVAVRNAFGRQVDSFEVELPLEGIGRRPFPAVFIRAPYIASAGYGVQVLGRYEGKIVMARQGRLLATAFHPELTSDIRVHRYFAEMARR